MTDILKRDLPDIISKFKIEYKHLINEVGYNTLILGALSLIPKTGISFLLQHYKRGSFIKSKCIGQRRRDSYLIDICRKEKKECARKAVLQLVQKAAAIETASLKRRRDDNNDITTNKRKRCLIQTCPSLTVNTKNSKQTKEEKYAVAKHRRQELRKAAITRENKVIKEKQEGLQKHFEFRQNQEWMKRQLDIILNSKP
jgi:hypothetical protein